MLFEDINIASFIEHTLLDMSVGESEIDQLCQEAKEYGFYAVCVPPCYVNRAVKNLSGFNIKVVSVVGFPFGNTYPEIKAHEAKLTALKGAHEIDMVMNLSAFKSGQSDSVLNEIKLIRSQVKNIKLKVIVETGSLDKDELISACRLVQKSGADFIKTSTGFGSRGVLIEDIKTIRSVVQDKLKIKASGGIRDQEFALALIESGADRLGTSSSVSLMKNVLKVV